MKKLRTALVVLVASVLVVAFVIDRQRRQAELEHLRESLSHVERGPSPVELPAGTVPAVLWAPAKEPIAVPQKEAQENEVEPQMDQNPIAERLENAFHREGPASDDSAERAAAAGGIKSALTGPDELTSLGCRSTMCRAEMVFDDAAALNRAVLRIHRPISVASYDQRDDGRLHAVLFLGHEDDVELNLPETD